MSSVQFEYDIPCDEYIAASLLYYKLNLSQGARIRRAFRGIWWVFAGVALIIFGCRDRTSDFASLLFAIIGAWLAWAGAGSFFLRHFYRRAYRQSELAGQHYKADVGNEGFEVRGESVTWRVEWPGVKLKAEDERVFMIYGARTVFIFGKKYLNAGQQEELRRLSGLARA